MKNTEYITIPKPELIEDYVIKSQIDLLTKIKTEIVTEIEEEYIPYTGRYTKRTLNANKVINIIDEAISKLKGE